jgi:integrase
VIARYLDWREANGTGQNPLARLRALYGRRLHPIVRALLEDDYERALERLRPLPEYGSDLGSLMREHIVRMQSLGYRYEVKARDLKRFDRYLQQHPELAGKPLPELLTAWRQSSRGVRHQLRVQQCGRVLTQALHRRDLATPVTPIEVGLQRRVVAEERKPYLFSEAEVAKLFHAARTYPGRAAPLRPMAIEAMLTLAYCAGLRIGEVSKLTLVDINLTEGVIEISYTKFHKSRRLPVTPSVVRVLERYLGARRAAGAPTERHSPLWWSPLRRKAYSYSEIQKLLTRAIRRAGLKPAAGRLGPHVHDLRHTFVAHRMLQWYREGIDPQSRLPHLATYLGHRDILSTLVYLSVTPELLQHASERYRQRGGGVLRASGGQP